MQAITDTGYLVALLRHNDEHQQWAKSLAGQLDLPLLTCEAVLAETAFHLGSSEPVLGMLRDNVVRIAFDCASHIEHLHDLAVRYGDHHPDLADLCLIRMSELHPRHTLITVDTEFRFYRRNKRDTIPALYPPNC